MQKGIAQLADLRQRIANVKINDKSQAFNTARIEALELQNLLEVAEATAVCSRKPQGVTWRSCPLKILKSVIDENWLCHTLYFPGEKRVAKRAVNFSPKTVPTFETQGPELTEVADMLQVRRLPLQTRIKTKSRTCRTFRSIPMVKT
ncbi:hypothetical protein [Stutzerimonas zhaodongensis]|uniref:hypothetical protein n=1 Tax=Stutzerimonas zhaodongensis TaxID=1176257 RepID=UPI00388F39DC